jgi:4-hydroxybenzoate polyprenyltransferase
MIAGRGSPPLVPTLLVILAAVLVSASVYIYNDIIDADMDRLNETKTNKPIAKGTISKASAKLFVLLTGVSGLALSYLVSIPTFVICLLWFIVFMIYSLPEIRLKKRFIIKEVTTSSGQIFTALMGGFAVSNVLNPSVVFAGLAFWLFTFLGLPAFADTLDMKEDALYGVKTIARVLNWRRKVQLMGVGVLFMMTVMPLTYTMLGFNVILPIATVAMGLIFLRWGIVPLMNNADAAFVLRGRRIFTVYVLVTQVVLIVSTLNF